MSKATSDRTVPAAHTILIVEDEVLIRLVIAEYLRDCGYTVHEAAHADEAMTILETVGIGIDLVFTDIRMPAGSMDGFGLAQWIRQHHPDVNVIITSGAARSTEIAGDLCEQGPLLAKPYEPAAALDRIKQLLARGGRPPGSKKVSRLETVIARA
jgi:CheY-like chemotaxis protein